MKVKTKKVTKTVYVYVADDGREFDNENACTDHEYALKRKSLICFNRNFEFCDFDSCTYVKLITEDDVKKAIQVCAWEGVISKGFENPGVYMYNDHGWINLTEIVSEFYGGTNDQT